jgi:hypothetical protein
MMNVHIVGPAEEWLISLIKPFYGIVCNDLGTHVGPRFALDELVRPLDDVRDMEYVIDASEFWIVYLNPAREDFRSDAHQGILVVYEFVVANVIVEVSREEGVTLKSCSSKFNIT